MNRWFNFLAGAAAFLLGSAEVSAAAQSTTPPAGTQPPSPTRQQSPRLDAAARAEIVHAAAKALRDRYVYPQRGNKAAAAVEAALAHGNYDDMTDPGRFAARLTGDLDAITHDKHMRVAPADPAADLPPADFTPPPPSESGVVRADRLAGNIGYVQVAAFAPVDMFKQPLDRVMAELAGTRAIILDLRTNIGGDPAALDYLLSYFVRSAPVRIGSSVQRIPGTDKFITQEARIKTKPPGSYAGKPVFVLISRWTFSAGEGFAFNMRNLGLGSLVGETTAGAANITNDVALPRGFQISVPYARGEGTSWEGVGVRPDVAVPAAGALRAALDRLGTQANSGDIGALSQARVFTPRSTAAPGGEAALRRLIGEIEQGAPNYDLLNDAMADALRERLPAVRGELGDFGTIESVTFLEVDPFFGDIFDVKFAHGSARWGIALGETGKVVMWRMFQSHRAALPSRT